MGYTAHDNHRFEIGLDDTKRLTRGHDFSYTLKYSPITEYDEVELRHTGDETNRRAFVASYTNTTPNPLWDEASVRLTKQDIHTKARTDDYCDGEHCQALSNPLGLQLKDGKVVDKMAILSRLLQVKTVKLCFMRMVKCIQILTASVLISIGLIVMSLTVIVQLMLMKQTMADLFVPLR